MYGNLCVCCLLEQLASGRSSVNVWDIACCFLNRESAGDSNDWRSLPQALIFISLTVKSIPALNMNKIIVRLFDKVDFFRHHFQVRIYRTIEKLSVQESYTISLLIRRIYFPLNYVPTNLQVFQSRKIKLQRFYQASGNSYIVISSFINAFTFLYVHTISH
jgi:hypothetical protein